VKILCFPWPPGPGEVRDVQLNMKTIHEIVGGDFEGHTLAGGLGLYCNDNRDLFRSEAHNPYMFPYIGFDLPGPADPDGIRVHTFKSMEELLATPRRLGGVEVWGPCMVFGPADDDGNETDIPEEAVAPLQQAFQQK